MRDINSLSGLFSAIAPYYDFLNRVISLNSDGRWRRQAVLSTKVKRGGLILDLCTGTADLAIQLVRDHKDSRVIGVDFSFAMLQKAFQKIERLRISSEVALVEADCLNLPFLNGCFDAVTIGFGLRNLGDPLEAMQRIFGSLKEGGSVCILEFSPSPGDLIGKAAGFYITRILPMVAGIFGGSKSAYGYLASSINAFISPEEILKYMAQARLKNLRRQNLYCGVVNCYYGEK